ncbi:MAG TPA: tRNA (guanosine(37)-N1)-methyltransferase TrmD, partial [Gammaproteobacteria bacterium]|nr:tRNA (guanosine(37)-N1)-methyltransferase TrmD [Gammaproteobacteria bacterium]
MNLKVVTLFANMFSAFINEGVVGRAFQNHLASISFLNPRDYADNAYGQIDDRPYGGGPGMVMQAGPLNQCIEAASKGCSETYYNIYLSPRGRLLEQQVIDELSEKKNILLLRGRYEGVDERLIAHQQMDEISIGDYVLSGGEPAAMVLIDALVRQLPGVLGHTESVGQDSFIAGLLDCPHFTRPECVLGQKVPKVLLSGDHQRIDNW